MIAAPIGVALAVWLSEYGHDRPLARAVESAIEMIAGAPSVVLAIFGLFVFSQSFLGFLSESTAGGSVTGKSFLTAGAIMALLALPLIVGATREGLAAAAGPHARGLLRPGQDTCHDDPPRAAAVNQHRTSPKGSCSAWAGSSATPRSC